MDDPCRLCGPVLRFKERIAVEKFLAGDLNFLVSSEMPYFSSPELGHMTQKNGENLIND
ncbi:MAG: hypothetical protein JAZ20_16600 [Candidatus Thiodiazotropha weberae]|nr:hypothetical protein [Candidatus Thiodiazotropha lotti]MCG8013989.1 hypothetical protein [Candidatus Thiodiazotropha lotti]MCG8022024.1 hypothetical protein [Candidatus Thiodiazotropha lotti]MCW4209197.1 hypothetical protein [Candidatus Thiodiazotropha lotti]MCW4213470.1 hypothetical protein [Candidatus Thiodiazotropha lotti]